MEKLAIRVIVKYSGLFRAHSGADQDEVELAEGATIHQLVEVLSLKYQESPYAHEQTFFVVNDRVAKRDQVLAPGDEVRVFQMFAGG